MKYTIENQSTHKLSNDITSTSISTEVTEVEWMRLHACVEKTTVSSHAVYSIGKITFPPARM